jgi:AmiR/NasT family two-component response regulator
VIDQARGILMARRGISAEQAFAELARESQNSNVKLRELAARLVESTRRS